MSASRLRAATPDATLPGWPGYARRCSSQSSRWLRSAWDSLRPRPPTSARRPAMQSASALPTNLAAAAKGPERGQVHDPDRRTTRLGRRSPRCGSARRACSPSARCPTRRRASASTPRASSPASTTNCCGPIADKLGLKVNFVGTDFSGLLAQVASAPVRRRLVVDHHHRCAAPAPSASPTATTSATSRWWCPPGRRSPASTSSPPANASASCRAPCRRPTSSTPSAWTR